MPPISSYVEQALKHLLQTYVENSSVGMRGDRRLHEAIARRLKRNAVRLGRLALASLVGVGVGAWLIAQRHSIYWHQTMARAQTVDLNLLAHTLPTQLSYALRRDRLDIVQQTLDSNYGLFGLVVTDPEGEEIIAQSKPAFPEYSNWRSQLTPDRLQQHPYDVLVYPPPLSPQGVYRHPTDTERQASEFEFEGRIVGRVYYIRSTPPGLWQDMRQWLARPFADRDRFHLYNLTLFGCLSGAIAVWGISEYLLYQKRKVTRRARREYRRLQQESQSQQEEARRLQQQLEDTLAQIPTLIEQRQHARAELQRYRQQQQQHTRDLERAVADYERQLSERERQQQDKVRELERLQRELAEAQHSNTEALETLQEREAAMVSLHEQLETLEADRRETSQTLEQLRQQCRVAQTHEAKTHQELDTLNQYIDALTSDRAEAEQQFRELERQLARSPDLKEFAIALEAARVELERVRERYREAEKAEEYAFEEAHRIEVEAHKIEDDNRHLNDELNSLRALNRHLDRTIERYKAQLEEANGCEMAVAEKSFMLAFSSQAQDTLVELAHYDEQKYRKVLTTLQQMSANLHHVSLHTHKYERMSGPHGEEMFEAYVENRTPSAWRVFWYYGPGDRFLTIHAISPHP